MSVVNHPVPKNLVTPKQYLDVIQARVYPHIAGVTTRWYPPGASSEEGVFVIEILAQPDSPKPFLVKKMLDEDDTLHTHFVGVPRRDGDRIVWMPAETIHHHMNAPGGGGPTPSGRYDSDGVEAGEADEGELTAAVDDLETEAPWLAYQAVPIPRPGRDQYRLQQVRRAIVDLPPIRLSGFNFLSMRPAEWVGSEAIRLVHPRFSLRVSTDCVATVSLPADGESLGWGLNAYGQVPLRVNPLTLAEYTLEFCRVASACGAAFVENPGFLFRVRAHGMKAGEVVLEPGPLRRTMIPPFEGPRASSDDYHSEFAASGDAEKAAYEILLRVYGLWGLDDRGVPYVDGGRISIEQIRSA